ncbi:MAG TPA: hypothetical protein VJC17_02270 [Candidatus Dojkabacteria bacterium]|nr:hypothetical protein [Candidatus Dojkabacteria bacterium]
MSVKDTAQGIVRGARATVQLGGEIVTETGNAIKAFVKYGLITILVLAAAGYILKGDPGALLQGSGASGNGGQPNPTPIATRIVPPPSLIGFGECEPIPTNGNAFRTALIAAAKAGWNFEGVWNSPSAQKVDFELRDTKTMSFISRWNGPLNGPDSVLGGGVQCIAAKKP